MKYFALLGVLALVVACGSKADHGGFITPNSGGTPSVGGGTGHAGRSGSGGTGGTGGGGGGVAQGGEAGAPDGNPLAPTVKITTPVAVSDPSAGGVLTGSIVTVVCSVTPASAAHGVQTSSMTIQAFGADNKQIGMNGNVHSTDNVNEYSASFVLTDVPNGPVSFKCSANDTATPPNAGTYLVETFLDSGPTITLSNPKPNSAHPLEALSFAFSALPAPLTAADSAAAVSGVTLTVNGVPINGVSAAELQDQPGVYELPIDLTSTKLFSPLPSGPVPVRIAATNKRGITNTQDYSFSIDSTGPIIQIVSPKLNQFVGGNVTLEFTVTDAPAGVDPSTVAVKINGVTTVFDPKAMWSQTNSTFDYTFNTINYPAQILLTINVLASDLAGNVSPGASTILFIDNVPPIVDMSPSPLQERQLINNKYQCSEPFDPLGDAPKDGSTVPSVNQLRSLIWDVGNSADGQNAFYFAGVDDTSVRLYFQPDTSKPLVKNFGGTPGGVCDAIDDDSLDFQSLIPILPSLGTSAYYDAAAPQVAGCDGPGSASTPPVKACNGLSDLKRVIQHELASANPAIPVVYAIAGDQYQCTGGQFDVTTVIHQNGWFCASVFAKDLTGNAMVSAPLRLCLDSAKYADHPCTTMSIAPPDCTKNCVPAPGFGETLITKP